MSFPIPPGSPRAAVAREFGRELTRAAEARGVSWHELCRATGLGRNSIGAYRRGLQLPRTEAAAILAEALGAPRLRDIVVAARTGRCVRMACGRPFRQESSGNPKRYCSTECRVIEAREQTARRRRLQGGQKDPVRRFSQANRLMKSGLRIAQERATDLADAIDAMCGSCEPEGVCHVGDCSLRRFSPLPLSVHEDGVARPHSLVVAQSFTPARRRTLAAQSQKRWARPGEREAARALMEAQGPAMREKSREAVKSRSPESFSQASRKAWRTRRERAAARLEVAS
jgi:transcriptional regulator with XRE-family HTH domain